MRALIQRVAWAEVEVDKEITGRIDQGLLVYVGTAATDTPTDAQALADKVANLRIFEDEAGKLNLSVQDSAVRGGLLVISNFTLLADARKGRRPAFNGAAPGPIAKPLYETFVDALRQQGCMVQQGVFGADMTIRSSADGPVNVIVDIPAPDM